MPSWPWPSSFAIDRRKISLYLLNPAHPKGRSRAKFFMGVGFDERRSWLLRDALLRHAILDHFVGIVAASYGLKFVFEGPIRLPVGGTRPIRTVWQMRAFGDGTAHFVTAIPL